MTIQNKQQSLHRFLHSRMFYPLAIATVFSMSLYVAQRVIDGGWRGPRLHVNLFLAWVPYFAALVTVGISERFPERRSLLLITGLVWFAFFPNAPYLVTDLLYLREMKDDLWHLIAIFMMSSICGLYLAVASLYFMHTLVQSRYGAKSGWCLTILTLALSGLGVFFGRFLRWNSWDLATRPAELLADLNQRLQSGEMHGAFLFSATFSMMLAVFYAMFLTTRRAERTPEEIAIDGD